MELTEEQIFGKVDNQISVLQHIDKKNDLTRGYVLGLEIARETIRQSISEAQSGLQSQPPQSQATSSSGSESKV